MLRTLTRASRPDQTRLSILQDIDMTAQANSSCFLSSFFCQHLLVVGLKKKKKVNHSIFIYTEQQCNFSYDASVPFVLICMQYLIRINISLCELSVQDLELTGRKKEGKTYAETKLNELWTDLEDSKAHYLLRCKKRLACRNLSIVWKREYWRKKNKPCHCKSCMVNFVLMQLLLQPWKSTDQLVGVECVICLISQLTSLLGTQPKWFTDRQKRVRMWQHVVISTHSIPMLCDKTSEAWEPFGVNLYM